MKAPGLEASDALERAVFGAEAAIADRLVGRKAHRIGDVAAGIRLVRRDEAGKAAARPLRSTLAAGC